MLGLVISSIFKSVQEIGEKNIIRHHYEKQRERTIGRTVNTSLELERREIELELARERVQAKAAVRASGRSPATLMKRQNTFESLQKAHSRRGSTASSSTNGMKHKSHILLLREENERFHAMRRIQMKSQIWKNWWRLSITLSVFGFVWCIGAVVFWEAEKSVSTFFARMRIHVLNYDRQTLELTYFQSVYFCWVSLLTIGYGDYSPKSGAGRTFFIIWCVEWKREVCYDMLTFCQGHS